MENTHSEEKATSLEVSITYHVIVMCAQGGRGIRVIVHSVLCADVYERK